VGRKTIVEHVAEHAAETPDKAAVIEYDHTTTYGELFHMVARYSRYLRDHGVGKGSIVVTKASQNLEYVVIYLGIHLAGGVIAALERSISDETMLSIAQQLGAGTIISDSAGPDVPGILWLERGDVLKIALDGSNEPKSLAFPGLEDSADILFTTGTTGQSKGVELTHQTLIATAENVIQACEYKSNTVMITPGPLNHASASRKMFTSLINGSAFYVLNGLVNLKRFFEALDDPHGRVACCLPPAAIRTIFRSTQDKLGEYADKIDFIESAGSPLPEVDKERLRTLLPRTRLYNCYGLSEAASVCLLEYSKYPGKENCIGKTMQNAGLFVVDEDKKEIQSSETNVGLLAITGETLMKGYVNEPELTAEVMSNGVFYTNDIGYMDGEGFIYVMGRQGDVINVGGLKVSPVEVESAALKYPGICDCICISVDDDISGKALKLLAVPKDGETLEFSAVRRFLSAKLEGYKVPHLYETADKIEKTYNGKPNRNFYRE